MKRLVETIDRTGIEESAEASGSPLTELSGAAIDQVSGGAGCWMTGTSAGGGMGYYFHSGYPPET